MFLKKMDFCSNCSLLAGLKDGEAEIKWVRVILFLLGLFNCFKMRTDPLGQCNFRRREGLMTRLRLLVVFF